MQDSQQLPLRNHEETKQTIDQLQQETNQRSKEAIIKATGKIFF
jgi:hypothetical protein